MNDIVIFGAGNIGRSLTGSIFSSCGWNVTFIDAEKKLVDLLNSRGGYRIIVKQSGCGDEVIEIDGVSAIYSDNKNEVLRKLSVCSLCATSVGQHALPYVLPVIAEAITLRREIKVSPLDIIIAENIRGGADFFRAGFAERGLTGNEAGLAETSIGKMVPIMKASDLADDPLVLHAEKYNTLIVDKHGFLNGVPDCSNIQAVDNIKAWVDRKLFIHNLGHAATAYFGYELHPERHLIADVLKDQSIRERVRRVMEEAAAALLMEYPEDFTYGRLKDHIDDLLDRFQNRALGDTVYRVGRDLERKLGRSDRILGAAALCLKHGLKADTILDVFRAALSFRAEGPGGGMYEGDTVFISSVEAEGVGEVINHKLGLGEEDGMLSDLLIKVCR